MHPVFSANYLLNSNKSERSGASPLGVRLYEPATTRFGLKGPELHSHPNFNFKLLLGEHITRDHTGGLHPTAKLIEKTAKTILSDGLDEPRALVLTNITDFFHKFDYKDGSDSWQKIHAFQNELTDGVWNKVRKERFPQASDHDFLSYRYTVEDGYSKHHLIPRPSDASELTRHLRYPFIRHAPHISDDDMFYTLSFGPHKNVEGGSFKVVDFVQFMKDKNLSFKDVFYDEKNEVRVCYSMKSRYLGKELTPYTHEVKIQPRGNNPRPQVPIIIMNNQKLASGYGWVEPSSLHMVEGIHQYKTYRTSVKPKRDSAYWKSRNQFPYHNVWLVTGHPPEE
ncbi:MAG: hypothetical protein KTR14_07890 [Vampirovibrio sp.]|nr:hypothetical protein [Vampirovibrio sp.]